VTVLIAAGSTFVIVKAIRYVVTAAPSWFFFLLSVATSTLCAWLIFKEPLWALGVTAVTHFLFRADVLLQAAADWVRVSVLQKARR